MSEKNILEIMVKKILLIVIFAGMLFNLAFSQQKFTVANLNYMLSPDNSYSEPGLSSNIQYLSGTINAPIVLNDKGTILTGFRGNYWTVNYSPSQIWPVNYYSLGLTLGYNYKFSDKKSFLFVLLPRLNSDLEHINSNALQLGFISTYSKRTSDKFLWKLGVYFNTEFFGPFVVPIFGLNWDIGKKLSLKGDLPIYAKLNYEASENFSTGLGYIALVSTYRLTGEFNDAYTSRFAIEPYLYVDVKLIKNLYLNGKAGYTMGRKYPVYAKDDKIDLQLSFIKFGDDREQLNYEIDEGTFIEFGISYKVDIAD